METPELSIEAYFRRQMTAIGTTAMEQISLLYVLVVGLRGCGVEIAKCLAFSGVQRLTLMDDELVREEDLGVNFLLRDGDQGKPKAKLMASRLSERAPFADVRTLRGALSLDLLLNFHVVVFASAQLSQEEIIAYDEFCRAQSPPIGVVVAESCGLFGYVFTDFSCHLSSRNTTPLSCDAEFQLQPKRTLVHLSDSASGDAVTVVTKEPGVHAYFQTGDHVLVHHDADALEMVVVTVLSQNSLRLNPRDAGGTRQERQERLTKTFTRLERVAVQATTASHRCLRESLLSPGSIAFPRRLELVDASRGRSLHMAMLGMHAFKREFGFVPSTNNREHTAHALLMVQELLVRNATVAQSQRGLQERDTPIQSHDVDEQLMTQALRCVSSELLPLSALIAGHAALQVLKYTGALGSLLYPASQFLYFDVLDLSPPPSTDNVPPSSEGPLAAMLGSSNAAKLRCASPLFVGARAVNMEVLKNLVVSGVGSAINVVLDPRESDVIQTSDLYSSALFSPASVGQSKASVLRACHDRVSTPPAGLHSLSWELWMATTAICADVATTKSVVFVDELSRKYEKPAMLIHADDESGLLCVDVVVPQLTATFAERLIAGENKRPGVFAFDHIPAARTLLEQPTNRVLLRDERVVQQARECFHVVFLHASQAASSFFERQLKSRSPGSETLDSDKLVWMVWSVAQRGHGIEDFAGCVRVAWLLLELLPVWLETEGSSESTTSTQLFELNVHSPDHAQLVVASACVIASSLRIRPPKVEARRAVLASVSADCNSFSLHSCPRSVVSIRKSFTDSDPAHMLTSVIKRVDAIELDLDDVDNAHLHFVQALANILLSWRREERSSKRVVDFPHLRRLCRDEPRHFQATATILGGLATIQLMQMILHGATQDQQCREYVSSMVPTGTAAILTVRTPPPPLAMESMPLEITRGVALRTIPATITRWSKIAVPTSTALQSARAVVQYIQSKFAVSIHTVHYNGRCVLKVKGDVPDRSIFDLCGVPDTSPSIPPVPFILLDLEAVDASGDVVLAPVRVHRTKVA